MQGSKPLKTYISLLRTRLTKQQHRIHQLTQQAQIDLNHDVNLAKVDVNAIIEYLCEKPIDERLAGFYLIDSICQRVGGVFLTLFEEHLVGLIEVTFLYGNKHTRTSLTHILQVWKERNIFHKNLLKAIHNVLTAAQRGDNNAVPLTPNAARYYNHSKNYNTNNDGIINNGNDNNRFSQQPLISTGSQMNPPPMLTNTNIPDNNNYYSASTFDYSTHPHFPPSIPSNAVPPISSILLPNNPSQCVLPSQILPHPSYYPPNNMPLPIPQMVNYGNFNNMMQPPPPPPQSVRYPINENLIGPPLLPPMPPIQNPLININGFPGLQYPPPMTTDNNQGNNTNIQNNDHWYEISARAGIDPSQYQTNVQLILRELTQFFKNPKEFANLIYQVVNNNNNRDNDYKVPVQMREELNVIDQDFHTKGAEISRRLAVLISQLGQTGINASRWKELLENVAPFILQNKPTPITGHKRPRQHEEICPFFNSRDGCRDSNCKLRHTSLEDQATRKKLDELVGGRYTKDDIVYNEDKMVTFYSLFGSDENSSSGNNSSNHSIRKFHARSISLLYGQRLKICSSCALRVPDKAYNKHLDWHFQVNNEIRERKQQSQHHCRSWYLEKEQWLMDSGNGSNKNEIAHPFAKLMNNNNNIITDIEKQINKDTNKSQVLEPLRDHDNDNGDNNNNDVMTCNICHEKFVKQLCVNEDEWYYENACYNDGTTRVDYPAGYRKELPIVHRTCYEIHHHLNKIGAIDKLRPEIPSEIDYQLNFHLESLSANTTIQNLMKNLNNVNKNISNNQNKNESLIQTENVKINDDNINNDVSNENNVNNDKIEKTNDNVDSKIATNMINDEMKETVNENNYCENESEKNDHIIVKNNNDLNKLNANYNNDKNTNNEFNDASKINNDNNNYENNDNNDNKNNKNDIENNQNDDLNNNKNDNHINNNVNNKNDDDDDDKNDNVDSDDNDQDDDIDFDIDDIQKLNDLDYIENENNGIFFSLSHDNINTNNNNTHNNNDGNNNISHGNNNANNNDNGNINNTNDSNNNNNIKNDDTDDIVLFDPKYLNHYYRTQ